MSGHLFDNHGRVIDYLRLAVTDRCNLRCFYCMPEEGISYIPRQELLSYEEMLRIVSVLSNLGIKKIRLTGGEPFLRKGFITFLEQLSQIKGIETINLTTNGTLTGPYIPILKQLGIKTVNLSIDSLDPKRFHQITRRDSFDQVMNTFHSLLDAGITTKLNTVVMDNHNIEDIIPLVKLTLKYPVSVRFIEEMPFNGSHSARQLKWNYLRIIEYIQNAYPQLERLQDPSNSTAYHYKIPGSLGKIGIIAAYTRSFCGSCNRIRITPKGILKTCLYDQGVFNIKNLIRAGADNKQLQDMFLDSLQHRAADGWEAANYITSSDSRESMATIGG